MTATPIRNRPMSLVKVLGACAVLGLIGGGAVAVGESLGLASAPLLYAAVTLVIGAAALWMSWRWWVGVDEAVREAHKVSWFWGGSTALIAVGAVALALFGISQGEAPQHYGITRDEAGLLFTGISFTVVTMLAGYGVCWAGWWLIRSR